MPVQDVSGRRRTLTERAERFEVCIPAEVRILDETGRHAISESTHGLISDLSLGGMRVHLVGPAAKLFEKTQVARHKVEVTLVPSEFGAFGHLMCRLRWSRPRARGPGWSVGLQYDAFDAHTARKLLDAALRYSKRQSGSGMGRAMALGAIAVVAFFVVFQVGNCVGRSGQLSRKSRLVGDAQRAGELEENLRRMAQSLEDAERDLETARAKYRTCEGQLEDQLARPVPSPSVPPPAVDKQPPGIAWMMVHLPPPDEGMHEEASVSGLRVGDEVVTGVVRASGSFALSIEGSGGDSRACDPNPLVVEGGSASFECPRPELTEEGQGALRLERLAPSEPIEEPAGEALTE